MEIAPYGCANRFARMTEKATYNRGGGSKRIGVQQILYIAGLGCTHIVSAKRGIQQGTQSKDANITKTYDHGRTFALLASHG
jgi:hypothetical protein